MTFAPLSVDPGAAHSSFFGAPALSLAQESQLAQESAALKLPLLDLRRFDAGGAARADFLCDLRCAARNIGFFYLTGHGVEARANGELMVLTRRFFALPEADKLAVAMIKSPHFRGYTRAGQELTRGRPDWREQFDIGAERLAAWRPGAPAWRRLQGPNQWPAALPELRPALLAWQSEVTAVAIRLLRAFAEGLGQDPEVFAPIYAEAPNQHIKIIRYPDRACNSSDQGVGPHKDSGLLTFVLQDAEEGLEVEAGESRWIKAPPRKNTFVVNIGELLELASNGYLRATVHRVVAPQRERFSIAFFLGARHDSTAPLLALPPELAREATGPTSDPNNPLFHHAGENYLKGRLRSHPDVAARHYCDLVAPQEAPDRRPA